MASEGTIKHTHWKKLKLKKAYKFIINSDLLETLLKLAVFHTKNDKL